MNPLEGTLLGAILVATLADLALNLYAYLALARPAIAERRRPAPAVPDASAGILPRATRRRAARQVAKQLVNR